MIKDVSELTQELKKYDNLSGYQIQKILIDNALRDIE